MKLTKISLLSLSQKLIELIKEFKLFKTESETNLNDIGTNIEELYTRTTVSDSNFSTMEKIVIFIKSMSQRLLKIEDEVIPGINNEITQTKVELNVVKSLAERNEEAITNLENNSVGTEDFSTLESKVSVLEFVTGEVIENKVDKTELTNYYDKNETIGKIAEELEKIVASAPGTLDTLKELADAINNDPEFADNIALELVKKASKEELAGLEIIVNTNSEDIARLKGQKYLAIESIGHDFLFDPVFYTPEGWVKVDISQGHVAEGIAVKIDDDNYNVYFDGVVKIPLGATDETGDYLSNGEIYSLSNVGAGMVTKDTYEEGVVQALYKVIIENGVKKAFIILDVPFML